MELLVSFLLFLLHHLQYLPLTHHLQHQELSTNHHNNMEGLQGENWCIKFFHSSCKAFGFTAVPVFLTILCYRGPCNTIQHSQRYSASTITQNKDDTKNEHNLLNEADPKKIKYSKMILQLILIPIPLWGGGKNTFAQLFGQIIIGRNT